MLHDWYPKSAEAIIADLWLSQPITVALLKATYSPDKDTHVAWADVSSHEVTGTGYTAGGILLTGKTTPYDSAQDRTDLRANDVQWGPGATFDTRYGVLYDNSGSKRLWSLMDFEALKSINNGVFTLDFAAVGALAVLPGPSV